MDLAPVRINQCTHPSVPLILAVWLYVRFILDSSLDLLNEQDCMILLVWLWLWGTVCISIFLASHFLHTVGIVGTSNTYGWSMCLEAHKEMAREEKIVFLTRFYNR